MTQFKLAPKRKLHGYFIHALQIVLMTLFVAIFSWSWPFCCSYVNLLFHVKKVLLTDALAFGNTSLSWTGRNATLDFASEKALKYFFYKVYCLLYDILYLWKNRNFILGTPSTSSNDFWLKMLKFILFATSFAMINRNVVLL